jgi:hypothetical protein
MATILVLIKIKTICLFFTKKTNFEKRIIVKNELMKSKFLFLFLISAGFYLFTYSCKKEEANRLPVIQIISPPENAFFNAGEAIPLHIEIKDDKLIRSVTVTIVDEALNPATNAQYYFPEKNSFSLIEDYVLPGTGLLSGTYYLKVRADDDEDFKNEFMQINIEQNPVGLEKIIVLTQPTNTDITVSEITNLENIDSLFSFEGDYSASAVTSGYHLLFVSGIENINLRAYDLTNHHLAWEKPTVTPWPMHNSNCMYFDHHLYVSFNSHGIYGYDYSGTIKYNSELGIYDSPHILFKHEEYIMSDVQKKNGTEPYIGVYYVASGVEMQRSQTDYQVVGFHTYISNRVIIVANKINSGCIYKYDIGNNHQEEIYTGSETFNSSVTIGNSNILIGSNNGIFHYSPANNALTPVINENGFFRLEYEKINKLLIAAKSNEVRIINLPEMTNQKTIPFSDSIINIHIKYE